MKQKTAPTGPKKNPSRNAELEKIYKEGMDHLDKPQKKTFGLGNAVFFLFISIVAGMVGTVFFLSQNDRFGLITVSQPENQIIIRDGAKAYQQQEEYKQTLLTSVRPSILRLYAHDPIEDPEVIQDILLTEEQFAGFGFILTSDGVSFTSTEVLDPEKSYIAVNWQDQYQTITDVSRDDVSGLAFFKFPGSGLQPADITDSESAFPLEQVYVFDRRPTTRQFSISEHTVTQHVQEQFLFPDSFISSSDQYFSVVRLADPSEYPKGAPVYQGDGTLMGFFSGNKDNPTVTYLPERRSVIEQYLTNKKVSYASLELSGIDISFVPYVADDFTAGRTSGFLLTSSSDETVQAVTEGSRADVAGLTEGDLITQVGGLSLSAERTIGQALLETSGKTEVQVKYIRDDSEQTVSIPLDSSS